MQQPYGQQPPPTAPQTGAYGYSGGQPPYTPPSRGSRFGRTLRLLLLRIFGGFGRLGRALRPHWLTAIIAGLLLAVIAVESVLLALPTLGAMVANQGTQRVSSIAPAPVVESYIKAQREFDAALLWDTFSEEFKDRMRQQGRSRTSLENEINRARDSGQQYVKFDYIGGVRTGYGDKFFYLAEVNRPSGQTPAVVSYVFTVDPEGKIAEIEFGGAMP